MKQCWRCRTTMEGVHRHHINGDHELNMPTNLINLCKKCHDLVQGICDECIAQSECHTKKFVECWRFDKALPPIHFRAKSDIIEDEPKKPIISVNGDKYPLKRACDSCHQKFISLNQIDLWCTKCMEELIKIQTPDKWEILQDFKRGIGVATSKQ